MKSFLTTKFIFSIKKITTITIKIRKNNFNIVFNKVEKSIKINAFSKKEDNGIEIDATKEILEIHFPSPF